MSARLIPALALALLAACENEPTFEERYSEAEATISDQAKAIESDLEEPREPPATAPRP